MPAGFGDVQEKAGASVLTGEDGRSAQQQETVQEDPGAAGAHGQRQSVKTALEAPGSYGECQTLQESW